MSDATRERAARERCPPRAPNATPLYCFAVPDTRRRLFVIVATIAVLGAALAYAWSVVRRLHALDARTAPVALAGPGVDSLPGVLARATGWVNGPAPTRAALAGQPVAALLWCDTDPRGLSALETAEGWRVAYERLGLRVIGIHEPAFAFAADSAVAARAARRVGAGFPIALDPSGELRRALGAGDDLPLAVVADTSGRLIWRGAGLARLAGADPVLRDLVARLHPERQLPATRVGAAPPGDDPVGEPRMVYLGSARVLEGPLKGAAIGRAQPFTAQFRFQVEGRSLVPYPVGWWTPTADGLTASRGGADNFVALRCDGATIYAVASPPPGGRARLWILRDEAWLQAGALGADARVDATGASYVDITEPRLYELARGGGDHVLKLSPDERGLTLHALVIVPDASTNAAR